MSAHRKQVEETMDVVREVSKNPGLSNFVCLPLSDLVKVVHFMQEMNLLVEADQPGNQLDIYICKLNALLSKKAAVIVQLQTRLAQFQRHLNEYNVLASSSIK